MTIDENEQETQSEFAFTKTRYEQNLLGFLEYHEKYPSVWIEFRDAALRLMARGIDRYSAKTILCVLRFRRDIGEISGGDFKINDKYTAFYARAFYAVFPERLGFFSLREQRSKKYQEFTGPDYRITAIETSPDPSFVERIASANFPSGVAKIEH